MSSVITVKGSGTAVTKPDTVLISMYLESKDKKYEKSMEKSAERIEKLTGAVEKAGLRRSALKTLSFNVRTDYESVRDKNGEYRQVFSGYVCCHELKLSFPLKAERLNLVLSLLSDCGADAQLGVSFSVKDPGAVDNKVLESAARNAREKAEVLCRAAGVKLGKLKNIEYGRGSGEHISSTRFEADNAAMPMLAKAGFAQGFQPDDITSRDSAVFTWEIE